jgi:hypothetical protein
MGHGFLKQKTNLRHFLESGRINRRQMARQAIKCGEDAIARLPLGRRVSLCDLDYLCKKYIFTKNELS